MSRQQELSMNGRQLFRSALLNIDNEQIFGPALPLETVFTREDHPLYVLYKKYKKEFPKGDPLICACEKNRINDVENMIKILLETNNKNVINNEGKTSQGISFTPLGIAARKGYLNIVQLLIENGVDSSICSKRDKWNVLHIAAYYSKKSSNVVEYLLKHLPEKVINQQDVGGETPLDNAYSNPYRVKDEIVNYLIKYEHDAKKKRLKKLRKKKIKRLKGLRKKLRGKIRVSLIKKNLTDEDALVIGELLKTNNLLKELCLNDNDITDVQSIGEALKTNNTLKVLHLHNNNITDVQSIGDGLKRNNTLRALYLNNNNITDVQSIIDGLKTNNTLRILKLENNQLSGNMKHQLERYRTKLGSGFHRGGRYSSKRLNVYY